MAERDMSSPGSWMVRGWPIAWPRKSRDRTPVHFCPVGSTKGTHLRSPQALSKISCKIVGKDKNSHCQRIVTFSRERHAVCRHPQWNGGQPFRKLVVKPLRKVVVTTWYPYFGYLKRGAIFRRRVTRNLNVSGHSLCNTLGLFLLTGDYVVENLCSNFFSLCMYVKLSFHATRRSKCLSIMKNKQWRLFRQIIVFIVKVTWNT